MTSVASSTSGSTSTTSSTASTPSTTSTGSTSSSTTSAGASILNTLGVGSGIDTGTLITNLTNATFSTKEQTQTTKESANTAQISEVATLSNDMTTFSSALNTLISGGTLQTQPTSSDTSVVSVTGQSGAQLANLSASITVKQIAKAQSLVSGYYTSASSVVGTGGLTLTTGTGTFNVSLDGSNDTLSGIAQAINASGAGVTASVITDANGARLALKGPTGAANAFSLATTSGSDPALSALTYSSGSTGGMTLAQGAQDAIVNLDGIDVSRASNSIGDLVDGVTLNLQKAAPDETITLGAQRPTSAITEAVGDFVSAYNTVYGDISTALAAGGTFANNSTIRQMQTMLSQLTSTVLNTSGGPSTLSEIGVSTQKDGTLALDSAALSTALTNYPDGVEAMFNPTQRSSSALIKVTSALGAVPAGTYTLTDVVADADGNGHPSGNFDGVAGLPTDNILSASITSDANGLSIQAFGNVASATVTIDSGLAGALQAITKQITNTGGLLDTLNTSLTTAKTNLATARTQLTTDESNYTSRLQTQFTAMNTAVAAYKSTQSALTQQVDEWTKGSSS
jgi:flagellar hook-associated protein 2